MKDKEKIAVFIDADNAPAKKIDKVLSELARYGVVNIRKAYGNWKNQNLKAWEDVLHEFIDVRELTLLRLSLLFNRFSNLILQKAKMRLIWRW